MNDVKLYLHNTKVLLHAKGQSDPKSVEAELVTGSRLIFTLFVANTAGTVTVKVRNRMTKDIPYYDVETLEITGPGRVNKVVADIHNLLEIETTVSGGPADYFVGVTIADNMSISNSETRIENAEIDVDLNHNPQPNGEYDSVRVGGPSTHEIDPNEDGSLNIRQDAFGTEILYPKMNSLQTLKNGSSKQMNVDGSTTPQEFIYQPAAGEIWLMERMSMMMIDTGIMSGENFGAIPNGLVNGLDVVVKSKGIEYSVFEIFDNADLALQFDIKPIDISSGFLDNRDTFVGQRFFTKPMLLLGDEGDLVKVVVRDDLRDLEYLQALVHLVRRI